MLLASFIRQICDLSCTRNILFLVQKRKLPWLSICFVPVFLTITRLDKDKAVYTVGVYFNEIRRLGYGNLLKSCFEVKDFGE